MARTRKPKLRLVGQSQLKKVFKKDATIARLVWMFPARVTLVPVFERFFQMKLDRVDELAVPASNHHLIAAEVGGCQEIKTFRDAIEL